MTNKKLKILEICAVEFTFKKFILPLCKYLNNCENWEVEAAYTPQGQDGKILLPEKINFIPVSIFRSRNISALTKSFLSLLKLAKNTNANIIHVHTPIASYILRTLLIIRTLRKKRIVAYTVHGFYMHKRSNVITFTIHFSIEMALSFFTDAFFFVSKEDYKFANNFFPWARKKFYLCPNTVNTNIFKPKPNKLTAFQENWLDKDSFKQTITIGYAGRLVKEKGIVELLQATSLAAQFYPNLKLILAGEKLPSDYSQGIKMEIEEFTRNHPNILHMTGMIDSEYELAEVYRSMDIFCLPSYREGLPTALLEAVASGVPSIATNIRGCNEIIKDGINGLLVQPGEPTQLASAICRLISEPQKRSEFSAKGRDLIVENYSGIKSFKHQEKVLRELAKQNMIDL